MELVIFAKTRYVRSLISNSAQDIYSWKALQSHKALPGRIYHISAEKVAFNWNPHAHPSIHDTKLTPPQKTRMSSSSNFSILGLATTLILGSLIIVLGYTLEYLIDMIKNRLRHKTKYSRIEWSANDILQTQRMAHEELGAGTGSDCTAVPVTGENQMRAIPEPKHPRLQVPSAVEEMEGAIGTVASSSTGEENAEACEASSVTEALDPGNEIRADAVSADDLVVRHPGILPSRVESFQHGGGDGVAVAVPPSEHPVGPIQTL